MLVCVGSYLFGSFVCLSRRSLAIGVCALSRTFSRYARLVSLIVVLECWHRPSSALLYLDACCRSISIECFGGV